MNSCWATAKILDSLRLSNIFGDRLYDCSAIAEMGDRLATIDIGRKLGAVPLWAGDVGPI